jgi:hypothetical protein
MGFYGNTDWTDSTNLHGFFYSKNRFKKICEKSVKSVQSVFPFSDIAELK